MAREFASVGVVGLGTMGTGIVEVFARNGLDVVAVEVNDSALERGRSTLAGSTERAVARGKLTPEDRDALVGRVTFAVGLDALQRVDLVVEAVPEHLDLKQRIFYKNAVPAAAYQAAIGFAAEASFGELGSGSHRAAAWIARLLQSR